MLPELAVTVQQDVTLPSGTSFQRLHDLGERVLTTFEYGPPVSFSFRQTPRIEVRSKHYMHVISHYRKSVETIFQYIVTAEFIVDHGSNLGLRQPRGARFGFVHYLVEFSEPIS